MATHLGEKILSLFLPYNLAPEWNIDEIRGEMHGYKAHTI